MRSVVQPDQLQTAWGPRPWPIDHITALRAETRRFVDQCDTEEIKDHGGLVQAAEMLEELAWILLTCVGEHKLSQWFQTEQNTLTECRELQELGSKICDEARVLKEALFKAQGLAEIQPATAEVDSACQFCLWAFQRIGQGLSFMKDSLPEGGEYSYAYLLATESAASLEILQSRAAKGCYSCHCIRSKLESSTSLASMKKEISSRNVSIWAEICWRLEPTAAQPHVLNHVTFHRLARTKATVCQQSSAYFHVETCDEELQKALRIYQLPGTTPLTIDNVRGIRKRLHQDAFEKLDGFAPTRLIDLGPSPESDPKLFLPNCGDRTAEVAGPLTYAALSYCWGGPTQAAQQLKLTSENINQMRERIPLPSMSPVMRDAVTTCRALDIRYLWIDAVCIMQDSKRDWEEQSAQMAQVYSNSWPTICAASSSSCLEGFLQQTPERPGCRIRVEYVSSDSLVQKTLTLRFEPGGATALERHPLAGDLTHPECDWNRRGWTFQERNLAPRKLIFGRSMTHFIGSLGITFSENRKYLRIFPTDNYGGTGTGEVGRAIYPWTIVKSQVLGPVEWQQIVEQYTGMQWTFKADVLPALSAIASLYQPTGPPKVVGNQDQYLAGLWKGDLHCTLLWTPDDPKSLPYHSLSDIIADQQRFVNGDRKYVMATWSWASRQHRVRFAMAIGDGRPVSHSRPHITPEYDLLEADVQVEGLNPYGRLKTASLLISARLLSLADPRSLTHQVFNVGASKRHVPLWKYRLSQGRIIHILPDWYWVSDAGNGLGEEGISRLRLMLLSSCGSYACFTPSRQVPPKGTVPDDLPDDNPNLSDEGFYPAYLSTMYSSNFPPQYCKYCNAVPWWRDIWGLLVYPTEDDPERYYRVGIWFSYAETGGSPIFEGIEKETIRLV